MKRLYMALAAVAGLAGLACSDGPTTPSGDPSVLTLPDLIVSDVLPVSTSGGPPAVASEAEMAFVSLPPGALPQMMSVRIRNADTGEATSSVPVMEGGFDPVPVAATAGHRLELSFTDGKGAVSVAHATVPDRRAPVVVRTNPPRGRTDVALSMRPWVVFSEPIDPETLAAGVRLLTGGTEVAVSVAWLAGQPWTAELVPATALEPGTTYELLITTDIRDLDGDALEEEVRVDFRTATWAASGALLAIVSGNDQPGKVGSELPEPFVVRVTNEASWGVPGAEVTFTTDASDADATLEVVPGYGDVHDPWVWAHFGRLRHPPLVVTVKDGQGNPVPHIAVDWRVESGEGRVSGCCVAGLTWSLPAMSIRTRADGFAGRPIPSITSYTGFTATALGPSAVTATVPGVRGSPVTFEPDATVALIWVDAGAPDGFTGPDGPGHPDVVVPVGTRVEFVVLPPTAHLVSTAAPPGGDSFDSGILNQNSMIYDPDEEPLFGFVPNVAGTWTFVDQINGGTGTLTATAP